MNLCKARESLLESKRINLDTFSFRLKEVDELRNKFLSGPINSFCSTKAEYILLRFSDSCISDALSRNTFCCCLAVSSGIDEEDSIHKNAYYNVKIPSNRERVSLFILDSNCDLMNMII